MDLDVDRRELAVAERELQVARREAEVDRREAALSVRLEAGHQVLADAEVRDDVADGRDQAAAERDRAADLAAFIAPYGQRAESYGGDIRGRRHAALDRQDSKTDRTSAAGDRHTLTEDPEDTRHPAADDATED